ncbi:hypothetical protein TcasGA2_TC033761 [Tribolium castaneum]|uniref:Uncharacterized protein n=2 Tax=Tribolium castaneum TaxID=7070 RepID=A0A139WET3_TRICA|nr:hypothetical protein TcasGA2_TC033761 [Tribolium castaneum]
MKKSKSHAKTHRRGIFDSLVSSLSTFLWPVATPFSSAPARSWIEATFHKRECVRFIAHTQHTKDEQR